MSEAFEAGQTDLADLTTGFVPFPPDRAESYRQAGYWTGRPLDSILGEAGAMWPDKTAVIDPDVSYTFAELDARADRIGAALADRGIAPGDRVLLQLPNSCEFAVALFGLLRAGAVPVMCLPGHRSAELSHFAEVSGAVGLVVRDNVAGFDYRDLAQALVNDNPRLSHVFVDGDPGPFQSWSQLADFDGPVPDRGPVDPAQPALLLVSGGTTGLPKLIARTHDDYVYNATACAQACELTGDDAYLVALPAGHNFPLACPGLLGSMTVGAPSVFTTDPSPESAFALIDRHKITVTALVNALAKVWTQACEWEPVLPKSLRLVQVGGSRMTAEEARFILERVFSSLAAPRNVFKMTAAGTISVPCTGWFPGYGRLARSSRVCHILEATAPVTSTRPPSRVWPSTSCTPRTAGRRRRCAPEVPMLPLRHRQVAGPRGGRADPVGDRRTMAMKSRDRKHATEAPTVRSNTPAVTHAATSPTE
jgi:non-ribosomal peptide synthetase component E (peptide arylation enzyme)